MRRYANEKAAEDYQEQSISARLVDRGRTRDSALGNRFSPDALVGGEVK